MTSAHAGPTPHRLAHADPFKVVKSALATTGPIPCPTLIAKSMRPLLLPRADSDLDADSDPGPEPVPEADTAQARALDTDVGACRLTRSIVNVCGIAATLYSPRSRARPIQVQTSIIVVVPADTSGGRARASALNKGRSANATGQTYIQVMNVVA